MKLSIPLVLFFIFLTTQTSFAQTTNFNIREPFINLWNAATNINLDLTNVPFIQNLIEWFRNLGRNPRGFFGSVNEIFEKIIKFLEVIIWPFREVLKAIGSLIVWCLELIIKLIEWLITLLG